MIVYEATRFFIGKEKGVKGMVPLGKCETYHNIASFHGTPSCQTEPAAYHYGPAVLHGSLHWGREDDRHGPGPAISRNCTEITPAVPRGITAHHLQPGTGNTPSVTLDKDTEIVGSRSEATQF